MTSTVQESIKLPFLTLLLLISFASVNAVLFTPALPAIANYFAITNNVAQQTVVWFLVGYALGQLLYGPIANRWGRKPAIYIGIIIQILSSLVCVMAGIFHYFWLLVVGRFFLAVGSGVGLKMTFTMVNECYEPKQATQKISYLMLAFGIAPSVSVALGGILNEYLGWIACFYAGAIYGLLLLLLVTRIPETYKNLDLAAFQIKNLFYGYATQFKNSRLVAGGLLMGSSTSLIYAFATLGPFIAINHFGMSSEHYGYAAFGVGLGLLVGNIIAPQLVKNFELKKIICIGIIIILCGSLSMLLAVLKSIHVSVELFIPSTIVFFGICFVFATSSVIAMDHVNDKAHGSAVMNFLNMGMVTIIVILLGLFPVEKLLLPIVYLILVGFMIVVYRWLTK